MTQRELTKRRHGHLTKVMRLIQQYGIEGGVRRIIERGAELEAVNLRLEKEIADHKRVESHLRKLALTDELTGLYNRRGFLTLAEQQLKIAHRMRSELSIVYIDVDRLKQINDSFGHDEGSAALRYTAEILRKTFRDSDIIARIGGDEFIVLVMQNSAEGSETITDRLHCEVADHNALRTRPYDLSLSVGIAAVNPKSGVPINEAISRADEDMYEHKLSKRLMGVDHTSVSSAILSFNT